MPHLANHAGWHASHNCAFRDFPSHHRASAYNGSFSYTCAFKNERPGTNEHIVSYHYAVPLTRRWYGQVTASDGVHSVKICIDDRDICSDETTGPDLNPTRRAYRTTAHPGVLTDTDLGIRGQCPKDHSVIYSERCLGRLRHEYNSITDPNVRTTKQRHKR